jgi:hypothetical protein
MEYWVGKLKLKDEYIITEIIFYWYDITNTMSLQLFSKEK